jgi:enoyl-CoA hydratase/3-hydroxyacyl-CoA dehydrogenase
MDLEDIETVAVLGAGNMGHGIAEVAALAGFDVRMRDIADEPVQKGYESIEWSLNKLAEHGEIQPGEVETTLERITPLVDFEEAVSEADFVIEAVPEKMEVKKNVYRELEQHAPEEAVFATNTSALSVSELGAVTDRPGQFCGMHFFNPPIRMQLVEVIAGAETEAATLEITEELARAMGKTPVRVRKDSPGFIANRVLVPLINEAAWMVEEGEASIEEVDSAVKYDMGLPMGAFELADRVGIDVGYHVLEYMHEALGEAYEPCPLLLEKVEAGELGQKSDAGFYEYDDGAPEVPSGEGSEEIVVRLQAAMANEVAKLVGEDVADPEDIDEALMLGGRFPEGPAKMADNVGLESLYESLVARHDETGHPRYEPAPKLEMLVTEGAGFYAVEEEKGTSYETIRVEREDGVGHVVLDRPHRMNTVSPELLDELEAAVEELEADDDTRALLLTGEGDRAFCAGADVQAVASNVEPLQAVELSRRGQSVFGKLEECDMPVVAGIEGYCLGGGMELATACDLRVAARGSTFGQTEHNLGLMPGWGGTQRLPNIVGEGRAKEIILTAEHYEATTMAEYGFVNELADDDLEGRARDLARDLAAGPPVAQRYTKRAMRAGRDDTEAGLEIEAQAFGHLLGTDDVMEGVTAFMSEREPEFEGK